MNAATEQVSKMQKAVFYKTVFKNVARRPEFSKLVCGTVSELSEKEKNKLRERLTDSGVVLDANFSDEDLEDVCRVIASRSVNVL